MLGEGGNTGPHDISNMLTQNMTGYGLSDMYSSDSMPWANKDDSDVIIENQWDDEITFADTNFYDSWLYERKKQMDHDASQARPEWKVGFGAVEKWPGNAPEEEVNTGTDADHPVGHWVENPAFIKWQHDIKIWFEENPDFYDPSEIAPKKWDYQGNVRPEWSDWTRRKDLFGKPIVADDKGPPAWVRSASTGHQWWKNPLYTGPRDPYPEIPGTTAPETKQPEPEIETKPPEPEIETKPPSPSTFRTKFSLSPR